MRSKITSTNTALSVMQSQESERLVGDNNSASLKSEAVLRCACHSYSKSSLPSRV